MGRRLGFIALLALGIWADQVSKGLARQLLAAAPALSHGVGPIGFKYAQNPGVLSSLGADWPEPLRLWLFTILVGLLLLGLLGYLLGSPRPRGRLLWCGGLILAGGLGNLLDRLLHEGLVTDFLFIDLGGLRSDIFNLADLLIGIGMVGGLLSVAWDCFKRRAGRAGRSPRTR